MHKHINWWYLINGIIVKNENHTNKLIWKKMFYAEFSNFDMP